VNASSWGERGGPLAALPDLVDIVALGCPRLEIFEASSAVAG